MANIAKDKLISLVEKSKEGDKEAFGELYKIYYDELIHIAIRHTGGNQNVAEDLVQDSMIKAMKSLHTLKKPIAFPGWIDRIVINRCIDYVESSAVVNNSNFSEMTNTTEDDEMEFDPEDDKMTSDPAEKLSQETRDKMVQEFLNSLPDDQRIATILFYYDDMSIKGIAEALGVKESTIIGRLQSAKKTIKSEATSIQKKYDIKLYGVAPWPFFLYVLGKASQSEVLLVTGGTATSVSHEMNDSNEIISDEKSSATDSVFADSEKNCGDSAQNQSSNAAEYNTETVKNLDVSSMKSVSAKTAVNTSKVALGTGGVTKVLIGIGVAVAVAGGGYAAVNAMNNGNQQYTDPVVQPSVVETIDDDNDIGDDYSEGIIKEDTSATEGTEQKAVQTVEIIPNRLQMTIPDSWSVEYGVDRNNYISKIILGNDSFIQFRMDRPDGGIGWDGGVAPAYSGEKQYGDMKFYEMDFQYDDSAYGVSNSGILSHYHSNTVDEISNFQNGDWLDCMINYQNVDTNDPQVIDALSSMKIKMECQVRVTVDKLNMRSDASTNSTIDSVAREGDTFEVLRSLSSGNSSRKWYQILNNGKFEWIASGTTVDDEFVKVIETKY